MIDGKKGGQIPFMYAYYTFSDGLVIAQGSLTVPAGAFQGYKRITVSVEQGSAVVDFSPSPTQFDTPLKLDLFYYGLNLFGVNTDKLDFYYIADDGHYEKISYSSKYVDKFRGILGVKQALLPHFSRFGWVI